MEPRQPPHWLGDRIAAIMGKRPVDWRPGAGGYTPAERWVVRYDDGSTAFVKGATPLNPDVATWLRKELEIYRSIHAPFLAEFLGWHEEGDPGPILLLEDLSAGDWPPPWSPEKVERVRETLDAIHASPAPETICPLEDDRESFRGWAHVAEDPQPFLDLRICSATWLDRALPLLVQAEAAAVFAGEDLLHLDVRSDNICFLGERTLFVDWNWACVGNGRLDLVSWLPSLSLEGGPRPEQIVDDEPELGAVIAGFFAQRAPMPEIPTAPRVRAAQKAQLRVALPWVAGMLGLPPPAGGRPDV
jgi:hypothetical protein